MKLQKPVSALISVKENDAHARKSYAPNVYRAYICSRLKDDAGSYRNASAYVSGEREKDLLIALCNEKLRDLKALSQGCLEPSEITGELDDFETPSYTQYILDAEFQPIVGIIDVLHFAYRRENKTLEMFNRLEQSAEKVAIKSLLNDAIRRQGELIMLLDAKLSATLPDAFSLKETVQTGLSPLPVP